MNPSNLDGPPKIQSQHQPQHQPLSEVNAGNDGTFKGVPVKLVDNTQPLLNHKGLGKRLGITGWKPFLKAVKAHPIDTIRLLTGRLAKIRDRNPALYLEKLCPFCTDKSHWVMLEKEGKALLVQTPENESIAPVIQRVLVEVNRDIISDIAKTTGDNDQFIKEFKKLGEICAPYTKQKLPFLLDSQIEEKLSKIMVRAQGLFLKLESRDAIAFIRALQQIQTVLPTKAGRELAKECQTHETTLRKSLEDQVQRLEFKQTVSKLQGEISADPENSTLWAGFADMAKKLSSKEIKDFVVAIKEANPSTTLILASLWDAGADLMLNPKDMDAWKCYVELATESTKEDYELVLLAVKDKHPDEANLDAWQL